MPKFRFELPAGYGRSIAQSISSRPIEHDLRLDVKSSCARWLGEDGEFSLVEVEFPDPRPTIPELIAKFHAEPTAENRRLLWRAIADHGEETHEFHNRFQFNGMTYHAATGGGLVVI